MSRMCRLASCESAMKTASISSMEGDDLFIPALLPQDLTVSNGDNCSGHTPGGEGPRPVTTGARVRRSGVRLLGSRRELRAQGPNKEPTSYRSPPDPLKQTRLMGGARTECSAASNEDGDDGHSRCTGVLL